MAAYYTSQGYDAPPMVIWSSLTDFASWPRWFPNVSSIQLERGGALSRGTRLLATGDDTGIWTRWEIAECTAPALLVCEHLESNAPMSTQVQAAYLQFELIEEPEGCTLEVEIGAEGHGMVGDFFVGMTLGSGVRRMLPQLVDAFTEHVVERVRASE
jgi:carbon monoxide dehydrogenase subunit G